MNNTQTAAKMVTQEAPELPSSQNTPNVLLDMDQFPFKEIQKLAKQLLYIGWTKNPTSK